MYVQVNADHPQSRRASQASSSVCGLELESPPYLSGNPSRALLKHQQHQRPFINERALVFYNHKKITFMLETVGKDRPRTASQHFQSMPTRPLVQGA